MLFRSDRGHRLADFGAYEGWELVENTFKPYACCLLTHATVDAARTLSTQLAGRSIERIEARVNPLCVQLAGKPAPKTPLEGKFSAAFCASLGLRGFNASEADFSATRLQDAELQELVRRVTLVPVQSISKTAAELSVSFSDGTRIAAQTSLAKGNPGNPMTWDDLRAKFMPLAQPALGARASELFDVLREFERPGHAARLVALVAVV